MLLRNKTMECTVPKRKNASVPPAPLFESPVPDQVSRYKLLVFRMPEILKQSFKMSLLKNNLDIQHTFEAFAEVFISWTEGEKISDPMKAVVKRSITLMNGV